MDIELPQEKGIGTLLLPSPRPISHSIYICFVANDPIKMISQINKNWKNGAWCQSPNLIKLWGGKLYTYFSEILLRPQQYNIICNSSRSKNNNYKISYKILGIFDIFESSLRLVPKLTTKRKKNLNFQFLHS